MDTEHSVGGFLKREKLKWQLKENDEKTDEQFASYIGVSLDTYNKWKSGLRKPTGLYIEQIASRLGDEIYTVLGLEAPKRDERMKDLMRIWEGLPVEKQDEFYAMAKRFEQSGETGVSDAPMAKPARKRTR